MARKNNTPTQAPAETIELDHVAFGFSEGALSIDGVKAYTWTAADAMLNAVMKANLYDTLKSGGYTKVDVRVVWADGQDYSFRYDVDDTLAPLARRVLDGLKYIADTQDKADDVAAFITGRDFDKRN